MRLAVILTLFLLASSSAFAACGCNPDVLNRRWDAATTIFTGKVTSIDEMNEYIRKGNANDIPVRVKLSVSESFKGSAKAGETFELLTNLTRDTCTGYPFEKDGEYLVFGYMRSDDVQETWSLYNMPSGTYDVGGLCGGTRKLGDPEAVKEIPALREKAEEAKVPEKGFMDNMFGN